MEDLAVDAGDLVLHATEAYDNQVRLSRRSLVDYLLTQTNVIAKVEGEGMPLSEVEASLAEQLDRYFRTRTEGVFRFSGPIAYLRKP